MSAGVGDWARQNTKLTIACLVAVFLGILPPAGTSSAGVVQAYTPAPSLSIADRLTGVGRRAIVKPTGDLEGSE